MRSKSKSPHNYPHRKLILNSGQIYLPKTNKVRPRDVSYQSIQKSDKFTSFKQQYQLPAFSTNSIVDRSDKSRSIDIKQRLKTLQNRPDRYRIKSKLRSKTIVGDNNFEKYVKKQLCSIDIGDLKESIILNHLDSKYLTDFEKEEIKKFKNVYYIGHKAHQRKFQKDKYNDAKGNYKPIIGDHIGYRFQIIKILGSGAFGKVLQVYDHKNKKTLALKILKESDQLYEQFKLQIKIMKVVRENPSVNKNIIQIKGDFQFRNHICIVTEMLSINLYSYLKAQNYQGLDIDIIRKILIQILQALIFLHKRDIIHCDIKPQNIVFKELGKSGVKLIDFGSACFFNKKQYTYIQSRYYRSPEIVLVKPYDKKIDIWSLGCLVFQLFTGTPLFPSRNQVEQMSMINSVLGAPPQHFLQKCERSDQFTFQSSTNKSISIRERLKTKQESLISFVQEMVRWSPEERMDAVSALKHPFILEGLPKKVRSEHMKQMNSNNPYNLY